MHLTWKYGWNVVAINSESWKSNFQLHLFCRVEAAQAASESTARCDAELGLGGLQTDRVSELVVTTLYRTPLRDVDWTRLHVAAEQSGPSRAPRSPYEGIFSVTETAKLPHMKYVTTTKRRRSCTTVCDCMDHVQRLRSIHRTKD